MARRLRSERGTTITEVMIASAILLVVTAPMLSSLISAQRAEGVSADLARSLQTARDGLDLVSREVRAARTVTSPAPGEARVWYDRNGDLVEQSTEVVLYAVRLVGAERKLVRVSGTTERPLSGPLTPASTLEVRTVGSAKVVAVSLIVAADETVPATKARLATEVYARNAG